MFRVADGSELPEQCTTGKVVLDKARRSSRRPRVLVWVLVGMLAGLIWALPQDPQLTRRVALTLRSALQVGTAGGAPDRVGALAQEPPPGFRLGREAAAHLQNVAGATLHWPVLLVIVLDDCGGCSEEPALRSTDFDGWRAGSVVVVGPASSPESELGPSVAKRAIVVSDRVSSWGPTSIGYQLGPFFSPRAYLMGEGWVVLASQRSDESLEQFVERIRSEAGGGRS